MSPKKHASSRLITWQVGKVRLAFGILAVVLISGCFTLQNPVSLANSQSLKSSTLALMDKATESYSAHSQEISDQSARLEQAYDHELGRASNGPSTKLWTTLLHVDSNLPGSGIYARFLTQWQAQGTLSPVYIADKKGTVGRAFDKIIGLENAKPVH